MGQILDMVNGAAEREWLNVRDKWFKNGWMKIFHEIFIFAFKRGVIYGRDNLQPIKKNKGDLNE